MRFFLEESEDGQVGARDDCGPASTSCSPFSLGRDSVFDICTRHVGKGDGNVLGLLIVDHSWGPEETYSN